MRGRRDPRTTMLAGVDFDEPCRATIRCGCTPLAADAKRQHQQHRCQSPEHGRHRQVLNEYMEVVMIFPLFKSPWQASPVGARRSVHARRR